MVTKLKSPLIDLTSFRGPRLSFQYYIDSVQDAEGGQLRFPDEDDNDLVILPQIFSGKTDNWTSFALSVPPEAQGKKVILEFRFLTDSDDEVGAGWYSSSVDDPTPQVSCRLKWCEKVAVQVVVLWKRLSFSRLVRRRGMGWL